MTDPISPEAAVLTVELIRLAEELSWAVRVASTPQERARQPVPEKYWYIENLRPITRDERSIDVLRRFVNLYRDEIAVVRAARNQAVQDYEISPRTLADAVEVGRRLVGILRSSAAEPPAPHLA